MPNWVKVLFGGVGVAAFTFFANTVWERVSHRSVGPDYVNATIRFDQGALLVFVRNESDEPLDLVLVEIEIEQPANQGGVFGAYPKPSHLYEVESKSDAVLTQQGDRLFVKLRVSQAIEPGNADQFGFKIKSASGPLQPYAGSISGKLTDLRGNVYRVHY